MPCGCSIKSKKETSIKKVILRNPKTGKKISEINVPISKYVNSGPQLLPGLRIIKEETYHKYVSKPRRLAV